MSQKLTRSFRSWTWTPHCYRCEEIRVMGGGEPESEGGEPVTPRHRLAEGTITMRQVIERP